MHTERANITTRTYKETVFDERGMVVTAYIVLRAEFLASDAMAKELQDHVKNQIAPYKYPRSIHFVDSLPKTTTGKLQRFRLKS